MSDAGLGELLDRFELGDIGLDDVVQRIQSLKRGAPRPPVRPGELLREVFEGDEPLLRDHVVDGKRILIGATHASLVVDALLRAHPDAEAARVQRLAFLRQVTAGPGERVEIAVTRAGGPEGAELEVAFRPKGDGPWAACARAAASAAAAPTGSVDIEALRQTLAKVEDVGQLYESPLVHLGDFFRVVRELYASGDTVLARLELAPSATRGVRKHAIHPILLNGAFTIAPCLLAAAGAQDSYLPFAMQDVTAARAEDLTGAWIAAKASRRSAEVVVFDVDIAAADGRRIATLGGCSVKRVRPRSNGAARATGGVTARIQALLSERVGALLPDRTRAWDAGTNLMDLGIESAQLVELTIHLEREFGVELNPTLFFEYPNIRELTTYLTAAHGASFEERLGSAGSLQRPETATLRSDGSVARRAVEAAPEPARPASRSIVVPASDPRGADIAIIGMTGHFPEAPDLERFWVNLRDRRDVMREIPLDHWDYGPWFDPNPEVKDKTYCKWGSFLEDVDKFDAAFFKISPREADWMDPQLRLMLQSIYETAEEAGVVNRIRSTNTGVFVGVCSHDYADRIGELRLPVDPHFGTGLTQTVLANRISFLFDFTGPSLGIDTACSSSLFALHQACNALRYGECDMAFVAGANLLLSSFHYRYFSSIGALSATGRCHSFDAAADGYVPGEAVASLLLKPLSRAVADGDRIYAVVKGSAALHGGYTPSLTAPSVAGEENVLLKAWQAAGIAPETLTYIEGHGTGTKLGDPIEITALKNAFKRHTSREAFCAVGSVKANIGHAEGAAGIAGVIKVALQMQHGSIPAMPKFNKLNPYIRLGNSALYINETMQEWTPAPGAPRRAGVSSFGFSGAYAHAVLEEYVPPSSVPVGPRQLAAPDRPALVVLSARNKERLEEVARRLLDVLQRGTYDDGELTDVAYTLQVAREPMEERLAFAATSVKEAVSKLRSALSGGTAGLHRGRVALERAAAGDDAAPSVEDVAARGRWDELLEAWVLGRPVDWTKHHVAAPPRRVALPTYPFFKRRHWLAELETEAPAGRSAPRLSARAPEAAAPAPEASPIPQSKRLVSLRSLSTADEAPQPRPAVEPVKAIQNGSSGPAVALSASAAPMPVKRLAPESLEGDLAQTLADALFMAVEEVSPTKKFIDMGLDSILGVEWVRVINRKFGTQLAASDVHEHPTIRELAVFIAGAMAEPALEVAVEAASPPAPNPTPREVDGAADARARPERVEHAGRAERPGVAERGLSTEAQTDEEIAIIGMAGRYPKARDVDELLRNLREGRDGITEVPPERWDHRKWYDAQRNKPGKTHCRWGGFLDGVDEFDPLLFKISPREAASMDPKIRLYLETVWTLLEGAGYTRESLQRAHEGKVGVYVGAMYNHQLGESDALGAAFGSLASYSYIANRVSYFFDLRGPSMAVDTACSSSLIAVHMACDALRKGECELAIAGGVNLTITPKKYIGLTLVNMLGSDPGRCRSFGDGDGFFPAEAVGALLLKPLSKAVADGDTIWAVIKSTAIDHKGYTKDGFYVPNADAQVRLLESSFKKAKVDPRTITYVEASASGAALPDATEFDALNRVFSEATSDRSFAAIGSIKSNIGHPEAASGVAQLTKVALQLRHRELFPAVAPSVENPNIAFEGTPFRLQRRLEAWSQPMDADGRPVPRRAVVGGFGAGGANAHIVLQEYEARPDARPAVTPGPAIVVLSARTPARLREVACALASFLTERRDLRFGDVAYTLQVAREAMSARLAFVAWTVDEIVDTLQAYLAPNAGNGATPAPARVFAGEVDLDAARDDEQESSVPLETLAQRWTQGARVRWEELWTASRPRRVRLPTYPFERRRCWVDEPLEPAPTPAPPPGQAGSHDATVVAILSELLGLAPDEIAPRVPLANYGVDSLVAMRVVQQMQTRIDPGIDVARLLECRTLDELRALVSRSAPSPRVSDVAPKATHLVGARAEFPELIPLNPVRSGRPVFWMHAGLGGVETYKTMAQLIRRPFFGIQSRGWMTDRLPLRGIHAMAAFYAHIVQTVQPEGPYDLGGYSFGGVLAYELARQLQELGQEVRSIVMLDTLDPTHLKRMNVSGKSELLQTVNTALGATMVEADAEKVFRTLISRDQVDSSMDDDTFLRQLVSIARQRGLTKTESQLQTMIKQCAVVQRAYEVTRFDVSPLPRPDAIVGYYFRNRGGRFWNQLEPFNVLDPSETPLDHSHYWGEWEQNIRRFHIMDVDCHSHQTILSEPHVCETVYGFCERLYDQGIDDDWLSQFKERTRAKHGVYGSPVPVAPVSDSALPDAAPAVT